MTDLSPGILDPPSPEEDDPPPPDPRQRSWLYEHRSEPLLPRRLFLRRMVLHILFAMTVLLVSLGIGIAGYHYFEGMDWVDALLNASMILGGMGPIGTLSSVPGKVFASLYALFSGVIFLVIAGILIAPLAHRMLHRLHLDDFDEDSHEP